MTINRLTIDGANTQGYANRTSQAGRGQESEQPQETQDQVTIGQEGGIKDKFKKAVGVGVEVALQGFEAVGEKVNGKLHEIFMPTGDGLDHPGTEILIGTAAAAAGAVGGAVGFAIGFVGTLFGRR